MRGTVTRPRDLHVAADPELEIAHLWTRWRYIADLFCGRNGALQIREVPEGWRMSDDDLVLVWEGILAGEVAE